jgi:TP901 family phage tail tape measure protein
VAERVLSVRLRAIVDGYEAAMGRAAAATDKVASTGKQLEATGKKMSVGFSLPMIAAGGFALRSAVQFESAFAGVAKTVDGTESQIASLRSGIIEMANQLPSTREEISAVAAAAGQLGIETPNILGFTRTMIDLGNSTDVAAQDAAMSLAQLANITQMSQSDFGRLGSSIVALGNNYETTESKIIEMAQRLAGAGAQIGLSEAEILGIATALSSVAMEAEAGGSAMSRVMIAVAQAVATGGEELQRWADVAGLSTEAFSSLFRDDPAQAFNAIVAGLGKAASSGGELFGILEQLGVTEIRTRDSLLRLSGAGDKLAQAVRTSTEAWDENMALTREAGARYATTESRLRMTANRLTDVARKAGEAMFPAVNAAMGVLNIGASGMSQLVDTFTMFPPVLQAGAGSLLAMGVAAGPTIWALGKLGQLYGPVITGLRNAGNYAGTATAAIRSWGTGVASAAVAMRTAALTGQGMGAAMMSMGAAIGPQIALVGILAGIGAGMMAAKRASEELATRFMSSAEAADILAGSVGLLTRELRESSDASGDIEILSEDDFREANERVIEMLNSITDPAERQTVLLSIAFEMRAAGNSPEDVIKHVTRLAKAAGVTVPAELTVEGVGDFENQVRAAVEGAQRAMATIDMAGDVKLTGDAERELTRLAESAARLWQADEPAAWARVMGEVARQTEGSAAATDYWVDEMLRLTGVSGLNTSSVENLGQALDDITGPDSSALQSQKDQLDRIREIAEEMDGGLTPETFAAAAAQEMFGFSADKVAEALNAQRDAADEAAGGGEKVTEEQRKATRSAEEFAKALDQVAADASFARVDFDAGAAAADAFGEAMDRSTRTAARLGAGLRAGQGLKDLREGLTGEKEIADIRAEVARSTQDAASSVDRLGDSARRADPAMSLMQIRLDALSAAGEAFTKSISDSTGIDDQIDSALNLGDAYQDFSKTFRRLPADLDMTAMATGRLRPRQVEAIQNMLGLGRAARDYLGTLIEIGRSDGEVAGEAARMREEYARMLAEMGLNEAQINRYLEAMGLLPDQVTTAIRVSGEAAARSRLEAYLSLLEGRIPPEVATTVIAKLEADDVQGAAAMLADFARSNPAQLAVDTKQLDDAEKRIGEVRDNLWQLPSDIDPLKALLGGYSDAQMAALDAVMQFGDGVQEYLSQVAHDGNAEEIRSQAYQIRDAFLSQIGMGDQVGKEYDEMSEPARRYLDLIGMSDWQIDSAINLSGDAEAMFRIQMYSDLLGGKIPPEVATEVLAAVDEGRLQDGANLLETWRTDMADGFADNPLVAELLGDAAPAREEARLFRDWLSQTGHGTIPIDSDTDPATTGLQTFRDHVAQGPAASAPVDADTVPAEADLAGLHQLIPLFGNTVTIDANTKPAETAIAGLLAQFPIFQIGGITAPIGFGTKIPNRADPGGADGNPLTPYALGGRVRGRGSNRSDSIGARLSNDEYVVQAFAARSIGYDRLDLANRTGILPGETQLMPAMPDKLKLDSATLDELARRIPAGGDHLEFTGPIVAPSPQRVPRAIAEATGTARYLKSGRRR